MNENLRAFLSLPSEKQLQTRQQASTTIEAFYWNDFLKTKRVRELGAGTLRGNRTRLEKWVLPVLGPKRLRDIGKTEVRSWLTELESTDEIGPDYIVNIWRNLSGLLDEACEVDLIERNVLKTYPAKERPRRPERRMLSLGTDLVTSIRREIDGTEQELQWNLALYLGLRSAESRALTWGMLSHLQNPQAASILIRQQLQRDDVLHGEGCKRIDGGDYACGRVAAKCPHHVTEQKPRGLVMVDYTKTHADRRIPLIPRLVTLLKAHQRKQDEWKKLPTWNPKEGLTDLILTNREGRPIRQQDYSADWVTLMNKIGGPAIGLTAHKARHLSITALLVNGASLSTVAAIHGHRDPQTTSRIYSQVQAEQGRADLLDLDAKETDRNRASAEERAASHRAHRDRFQVMDNVRSTLEEREAYSVTHFDEAGDPTSTHPWIIQRERGAFVVIPAYVAWMHKSITDDQYNELWGPLRGDMSRTKVAPMLSKVLLVPLERLEELGHDIRSSIGIPE